MTAILSKLFPALGARSVRELPVSLRGYRNACRRIDRKRKIMETSFVAVDTELTGLDFKRDTIVSIGAIKLEGTRIKPGESFYRLVRPESELNGDSVVVHELTHTDLAGADEIADVLVDFLEFAGDSVLIGHFVNIEQNFLSRALKKHYGIALSNPAVDTSSLHDWLYENDSSFAKHHGGMSLKSDLFTVAKRYGIEVEHAHNAFGDAFMTAQLFQRFAYFLPGCGVESLQDLLAVGKP